MALSAQAALRRRALQWLAQREHSRQELHGKLERWWRHQADLDADAQDAGVDASLIDSVLQTLQAQGHLDETRLVESRVHARQSRFGNRRIAHELRGLGVVLADDDRESLGRSELQRAHQVLERRFGPEAPASAQERACRMRFLAARGFTAETIGQALRLQRAAPEDE